MKLREEYNGALVRRTGSRGAFWREEPEKLVESGLTLQYAETIAERLTCVARAQRRRDARVQWLARAIETGEWST